MYTTVHNTDHTFLTTYKQSTMCIVMYYYSAS